MKEVKYYCDCCGVQIRDINKLKNLELSQINYSDFT